MLGGERQPRENCNDRKEYDSHNHGSSQTFSNCSSRPESPGGCEPSH